MKTIKNSKDITTLEVGNIVVFGNVEHIVDKNFKHNSIQYYLNNLTGYNDLIFETLNIERREFIEKLGIDANYNCDFPETKSLEALTAIVSALFKEYERQNELPKTWEEFCKRNKIKEGESYIDCYEQDTIEVDIDNVGIDRDPRMDKNLCTSKQEAKAFLALMQLRQLRKAYVKNWEPDWTNTMVTKYSIICIENVLSISDSVIVHHVMSFPNSKLAKQFFNNFKDLLEIAKPLL